MAHGKRVGMLVAPPADWSRYGLDEIWDMLQPQVRASGEIATGMWQRMHRLCAEEADLIEQALRQLEQRWPTTQPAAVAFQELGAHLVAAMRATSTNASSTGTAVDVITEQIERARGMVAGLIQEAEEYREIEARVGEEWATKLYNARRKISLPMGMLVPWRDGLNIEAREAIANAEQVIGKQYSSIRVDERYEPPLPEPRKASTPSAASSGRDPSIRIPSLPDTHHWNGSEFGGATVLDGVPPSPGSSVVSPPTGAIGALSGGEPAGSFVDTPAGRVLAPGGVIGPPVPGAIGGGGTPGVARGPGGPGAAARPTGGPGIVPMIPPMGPPSPGGATAGQPSSGRRGRGLPSVFQVPPGPPAVIRPPEETHVHDPGPGVIGIDR